MNFIDKCQSILPDYLMEVLSQDLVRFLDYPYKGMLLVIRNEEHQYTLTSSRRNELSILEYYEQLVPKCDFINLDLLKYEVEKLKGVWK